MLISGNESWNPDIANITESRVLSQYFRRDCNLLDVASFLNKVVMIRFKTFSLARGLTMFSFLTFIKCLSSLVITSFYFISLSAGWNYQRTWKNLSRDSEASTVSWCWWVRTCPCLFLTLSQQRKGMTNVLVGNRLYSSLTSLPLGLGS